MNKISLTLFYIIFFLTSLTVCGEVIFQKDSIKKSKGNKNFFGFPAVIYSPETTLSFGGAATFYFKVGDEKTTNVRTSFIQALGMYSLRKQAVIGIESTIFFRDEKYILKTQISASKFPDRFWGIGNNSQDEDMEKYIMSQYYIYPQLLRKVYKNLFIGGSYEIQNVFSMEYGKELPQDRNSLFDTQNVPGKAGSIISGIGYVILWDNRDNSFNPYKGFYISATYSVYHSIFGSQYMYSTSNIDIRKYIKVAKEQVLAFQLINSYNEGEVPIRSLASIGSSSMLRGYYKGRFTDKNLFGIQAEYRFPVIGRFGMIVFSALGRVGNSIPDIYTFQHLKPSFGTGIRYLIDRKERLNLRLDYGIGNNADGIYLNLSEAF